MDKKEKLRLEIKDRFFKVMRLVISERLKGIDTEADFANAIDSLPQQLSHIKNQEGRNVTIEMIHNTCHLFQINSNYIILGLLPIHLKESSADKKLLKIQQILKE